MIHQFCGSESFTCTKHGKVLFLVGAESCFWQSLEGRVALAETCWHDRQGMRNGMTPRRTIPMVSFIRGSPGSFHFSFRTYRTSKELNSWDFAWRALESGFGMRLVDANASRGCQCPIGLYRKMVYLTIFLGLRKVMCIRVRGLCLVLSPCFCFFAGNFSPTSILELVPWDKSVF